VLSPVGTAPGLVVPPAEGRGVVKPTVLVLPGPPRELQAMWPAAVATEALRGAIAGRADYRQATLRLFGIPESEIAESMRAARERGIDIDAFEITTCLRGGEIEVVSRFEPPQAPVYDAFAALVREQHGALLFSEDGSTVDDLVARLLGERGLMVATAESCTGGLVSARLTARAGASAYVAGGLVAYSNEAKVAVAGVAAELIERHGAVSEEVAEALADGARARLGADVGVGITGIAGPGGGTPEKPVGLVCFSVSTGDGRRLTRSIQLPGSRSDIRDRAVTVAMHLLRRVLMETDAAARGESVQPAPEGLLFTRR
jgi:nicotinamide-nucleotide amidase